MDTFKPENTIVPIVRASGDDPIQEILGTGCIFGKEGKYYILTAKHIFDPTELDEASKYGFVLRVEKGIGIWAISTIIAAEDYDVAICEISDIEGIVPMQFSKQEPALNADVFCYEYSRTSIERRPGGGKHVEFQPFSHKGNITRYFNSTYPEPIETPCFNTSFPALQGASGAPVIANTKDNDFYIAGIMVANRETHLMPAQVVSIIDGENYMEETKYFLPMGKGINSSLIAPIIEGLGIELNYV